MNRLLTYFPLRTLCLVGSEIALVALGFFGATIVQFGVSDATRILTYEQGIFKLGIISAMFVVYMYYFDLYDSVVLNNRRELLARMAQVIGTVSVTLALLYSLNPALRLAHGISLMGILLGGGALIGARGLFLLLNNSTHFVERSLVLGDGPLAHVVAKEIKHRPELGIRIVGAFGAADSRNQQPISILRDRVLDLPQIVESQHIKRIILTPSDRRGKLPLELLLQLKKRGIRIDDGAELYERVTGKVPLEVLTLSSLLFSRAFRLSRLLLIYKRTFSILGAFLALLICAPLIAVVAIAIRLDSPGPAIFRQKRVGKDAKAFVLYKFRSMYSGGSDQDQNERPAMEGDDRFTRIGRWLRRTRIDELPQLYNILRGEMYFVGPRPFVRAHEDELAAKIPFYSQRWAVRPGATGWAQVNRGYCATVDDNAEKLAYDLFYIKNMSIGLDLFILFKTIKILLLGRGSR